MSDVKYTDLSSYYREQKDKFLEKSSSRIWSRILFWAITFIFVLLIFKTEYLVYIKDFVKLGSFIPNIVFQIIFWILAIVFAFYTFLPTVDFFHKKTNWKVKDFKRKKFHLEDDNDMEKIIWLFETKNFEALKEAPETSSGSLELIVEYEPQAKEAYLLLRNMYYGDVNYSSDVIVLSGDEYDENFEILKKI